MENNYNNDELNKRVMEKLQRKIAISEFKEKECKEESRKPKVQSFKFLKVAAAIMLVSLIAGNTYIYATYDTNIFSWILGKIGIVEEYDKTKKDVNVTKESNQNSLTIIDYGIDKDTLIVGYNLKLKNNQDFFKKLCDTTTISNGKEVFSIGQNGSVELFNKISDTEYVVYKLYEIDADKLASSNELKTDIILYEYLYEGEEKVLANWSFNIEIQKDKNLMYEEFVAENKSAILEGRGPVGPDYPIINLLEVKKSDITTKLTFLFNGYTTEPGITCYVEVLDETGNILLENNLEYLMGGVPTDIIFKKIDFNSKIKVNFYETDEYLNIVLSKGTMEIDLKKDLIKKQNGANNKVDKAKKEWKDLEFEYIKGTSIDEGELDFIQNPNSAKNYSVYIELSNYFGNYKNYLDHISIICFENIYNNDLSQAVETVKALEYLGGYGLMYKYPIYLSDSTGEITEDIEVTHEQMMSLAKNKELTINGRKIKAAELDPHEVKYQDEQETKIDGKQAITWVQDYGGNERKYIFIHNNYIYEITCPTEFDTQKAVQEFIDSIKIKD